MSSFFKVQIKNGGEFTTVFFLFCRPRKINLTYYKATQITKLYLTLYVEASSSLGPTVSSPLSTSLLFSALLLVCDFFFVFERSFKKNRWQVVVILERNPQRFQIQLVVLLHCLIFLHYPLFLLEMRHLVMGLTRMFELISWFLISGVPFL